MEPSRGSEDEDDAGAVGGKCELVNSDYESIVMQAMKNQRVGFRAIALNQILDYAAGNGFSGKRATRQLLKAIDRLQEKDLIRSVGQQNFMETSVLEELGVAVSEAKRQKKQQDPDSGNLQQNRDKMDSKNNISQNVSTELTKVPDTANTKKKTEFDPRIVVEIRKPLYTMAKMSPVPSEEVLIKKSWNRTAENTMGVIREPSPSNQYEAVAENFKKQEDPMNLVTDTANKKKNESNTESVSQTATNSLLTDCANLDVVTEKEFVESFHKLTDELASMDNDHFNQVVEFFNNNPDLIEKTTEWGEVGKDASGIMNIVKQLLATFSDNQNPVLSIADDKQQDTNPPKKSRNKRKKKKSANVETDNELNIEDQTTNHATIASQTQKIMEPSSRSEKEDEADVGAVGGKRHLVSSDYESIVLQAMTNQRVGYRAITLHQILDYAEEHGLNDERDARGLCEAIIELKKKEVILSVGYQIFMEISALEELGETVAEVNRKKRQQHLQSENLQQSQNKLDSTNIILQNVSTEPTKVPDEVNAKEKNEFVPETVAQVVQEASGTMNMVKQLLATQKLPDNQNLVLPIADDKQQERNPPKKSRKKKRSAKAKVETNNKPNSVANEEKTTDHDATADQTIPSVTNKDVTDSAVETTINGIRGRFSTNSMEMPFGFIEFHECCTCPYRTQSKELIIKHVMTERNIEVQSMMAMKNSSVNEGDQKSTASVSDSSVENVINAIRSQVVTHAQRFKTVSVETPMGLIEYHECCTCPFRTKGKEFIIKHVMSERNINRGWIRWTCKTQWDEVRSMMAKNSSANVSGSDDDSAVQTLINAIRSQVVAQAQRFKTVSVETPMGLIEYHECCTCPFRTKSKELIIEHVMSERNINRGWIRWTCKTQFDEVRSMMAKKD